MKLIAVLHGPKPEVLNVRIHHRAAPVASVTEGVTEQIPVLHPACVVEYHCCHIGEALESLTHRKYQVAEDTAFQVYVGLLVEIAPEGEIRVAAPGTPLDTVNDIASLHGPSPESFQV